jgi:hypothetical protein
LPQERLVYQSGMEWFPPPRSGILGISRLLPSQTMDILSGAINPRPLLAENSPASVEELAQPLVNAMRAVGEIDIPLTGGRDSRLVLAAGLAADVDVITHTDFRDGMDYGDLVLPPKLAQIAGVPHYTIRAGRVRDDIVALFDRHCALHSVERVRYGLASGRVTDFGRPLASGNVFELGRLYYHSLPADIDQGLKHKPAYEWADWIRQHPEALDWRDRFYWEQRLGGWASASAQAMDLVTFERFFPANNRRFITGLLSFPEAERRRAAPQQAMLEHLAPELAAIPTNPQPGTRITRRLRREAQIVRQDGIRYVMRRGRALRSHR